MYTHKISLCLLSALATAIAGPTVHLAGDSTMVSTGNNDGTRGWGAFLSDHISLPVVNNAVAGRSARSFTREGKFQVMAGNVKPGDFVVMEFGHNDGGPRYPEDGRRACDPVNNDYSTTCKTIYK